MTHPFDDDDELPRRRPLAVRLTAIGIVVALLVGLGGGLVRACGSSDDDTIDDQEPLLLESSGTRYTTLEALVAASTTVVIAEATAVSPGRIFGGGGSGDDGRDGEATSAVRSQIVTLRVGRVLAGQDPGPTVAMEEEAELADGRPIVVDGLRPTRPGDQGIFFLEASTDRDVPYFATASTSGRLLRASRDERNDELVGTDDPLAEELAALGGNELTDRIRALAMS